MTTEKMKLTTRLGLLTWLIGGASCCWQAATGLVDPGEWFYRDLQLAMSGLALIIPGVMLLTRFSPGSPALFAVANLGGWFLGTIALVQLPTGGGFRAPLTAIFFACGGLYGVLGFTCMFLNRNSDSPSDDDHDTPASK